MIYLTRMLGKPVIDAAGETIGHISDVAIATGEIFPRVTSLAFLGPDKTPFMLSWRKFVADFDDERVELSAAAKDIRFSYLQPAEVLLHRDLLNKQIVDTQGMKVVRVNDLKLSESRNQLRLLGAEVGVRGIIRGISPGLERAIDKVLGAFGGRIPETLIAWNYLDLVDRDLSHVQLSVTHKRLRDIHPADVADILEQLSPSQRAKAFEHLDNTEAAEAISELEDEYQADVIDDLTDQRASDILEMMDPDDAADIIGDLPYEKAEALLRLMGVKEAREVRKLLGYKEKTAGGIMTSEVTTVTEGMTVAQVIEHLRSEAAEHESIYYIYVVDEQQHLAGVLSLRDLIVSSPDTAISDIAERELFTAKPEEDQEDVAEMMSKYDLLALPVVDENGEILGIVTVDDALEVMEEESAEDLALATGRRGGAFTGVWQWVSRNGWLVVWSALLLGLAALGRAVPDLGILIVIALLSLPILRLAEDVAGHAVSRAIEPEDAEERTPLWRRALRDAVAGVVLGVVLGMVAFGVVEIVFGAEMPGGDALVLAALAALAFGVSAFVVTLAGTVLGELAERRARAEKRVSQTAIAVTLMLVGFASFALLLGAGLYIALLVSHTIPLG